MNVRFSLAAVALAAAAPLSAAGTAHAAATTSFTAEHRSGHSGATGTGDFDYYLALGDSLAAGVQPEPDGTEVVTRQGYADDLAAQLRRADRHLGFVDLGCPNETTTTMLEGGCPSPHTFTGDQTDAAAAFLAAHRNARVLVTISIGANDVDKCVTTTGIDLACVEEGLEQISANLPAITAKLTAAAGARTTIVGVNYYDPFLATWLDGATGQAEATASVSLLADVNDGLGAAYQAVGIPVADVATAFDTTQFTPLVSAGSLGQIPLNVARVCSWTWMCAAAPQGPNIHPNVFGYRVMTHAIDAVLTKRR